MHILYDYQIFSLQKMGGISRYFVELSNRLKVYSPQIETTVLAPLFINDYLHRENMNIIGKKIIGFPKKHHVLSVLNSGVSRCYVKNKKYSVLHETYYSSKSITSSCPRVITVFDMIHEIYSDQFTGVDRAIPRLKKQAVERADHIIAISENTRNDAIKYLKISPEKVSVVPLGVTPAPLFDEKSPYCELEHPYILYVGLREGVKNFRKLLEAYALSDKLRDDFHLVCVGGGGFTSRERMNFVKNNIADRVHHVSASDGLLWSLYRNATLFVYPSLYEGFGLPLLEAMACDCPVACSNRSSMPEIAGEAAVYFNPESSEDMRFTLEEVIDSEEKLALLRDRGRERVDRYSWENCIENTVKIYKKVA